MAKTNITDDLFIPPKTQDRRVYSVSEITQNIKIVLENTFSSIWVEGEVSGFSQISTGTAFFSLKDQTSLIKCVMFFSFAKGLKFEIKDGMSFICYGRVSVYEKDGKYQFYVERIEPKGIGGLQLALEQLKAKLEKDGLFAPEHKKPIPYLPSRIGIVTSLTGAAIKDMFKVLDRRFGDIHIIVNPVRVQGEGAREEIAQAIDEFNRFNETVPVHQRIEVMIVGRGGGSIEDLWAFNEEIVARAIYRSAIPVISAVGHERDVTIADLVADVRAATPSVAAEIVAPKKEDLKERLNALTNDLGRAIAEIRLQHKDRLAEALRRLALGMEHLLTLQANECAATCKKLMLLNPSVMINRYAEKTDDLARQIYLRMQHLLALKKAKAATLMEKLSSLSPLNILARGYSITFLLPERSVVKEAASLKAGTMLQTRVHQGAIVSEVKEVILNG